MHVSRDPIVIFRHFAADYTVLTAPVPTTVESDAAIDAIIEGISSGKEIFAPLSSIAEQSNEPSNFDGRGCAREFLDFLCFLQQCMKEQGTHSIAPLRAVELLYNFDSFSEWGQDSLRLIDDADEEYSLVSTLQFEARFNLCVRLPLPFPNYTDDWTIKPALPPKSEMAKAFMADPSVRRTHRKSFKLVKV